MKLSFELDINQTRTVGMPLQSADFDHFDKENPFTKMESNPEKMHRCVDNVKKKKSSGNAWAICNASING
jgi:hypothetical protein